MTKKNLTKTGIILLVIGVILIVFNSIVYVPAGKIQDGYNENTHLSNGIVIQNISLKVDGKELMDKEREEAYKTVRELITEQSIPRDMARQHRDI